MANIYSKNSDKSSRMPLILIALCSFFFLGLILPVLLMLFWINPSAVKLLLSSLQFKQALINSVSVTAFATLLAVPCGLAMAYITADKNDKNNLDSKGIKISRASFLSIIFSMPMLIPSISHGMGLVNLFGNNGIITSFFGVDIGLYGFNGIAMGSFIYSLPVAYLMFADALSYTDNSLYEAADIMGVSPLRTFIHITLPWLKRSIISVTFAVFTMIFTDYGVPLAVGGRYITLPVLLYREVIGQLDFAKGALIGVILIVPAIAAFFIDASRSNAGVFRHTSSQKSYGRRSFFTSFLSGSFSILIALFLCLPVFSFVILAFAHRYPIDMTPSLVHLFFVFSSGFKGAFTNSVAIALMTAVVGAAVSFVTAYVTARRYPNNAPGNALHLLSMVSLAVPGIVLGLGYIITFKSTPLYGTLLLLVFVNIIHFFAAPYLMAYNALLKLDMNFEPVGMTLGVSTFRIFSSVILPSALGTLLEMGSYFFVNSMITISAVAFLFNVHTRPLSMLIPQFESNLSFEAVAVVSLALLITNIVYKCASAYCKNKLIFLKAGE